MAAIEVSPVMRSPRLSWVLLDSWTLVRRNLTQFKHTPSSLVAMVIFPLIMIVVFGYIFGSAIAVPGGGNYREYLTPGLFATIAAAQVTSTMSRVAADNRKGVMDRYRSMPIARAAVPFGQTGADLILNTLGMFVMMVCGFLVGWKVHHGLWWTLAGCGVLILFSYSLSWVGVLFGFMVKDEETANRLTPLFLPVTMLSNTFVPTEGLPSWLRTIADWNPVSAVVAACRYLFGNPGGVQTGSWPMAHPVLATIGWSLLLLVIVVPLATRRFQTAGR